MKTSQKYFPICAAMAKSMHGYNVSKLRRDFVAAIIVSLVALPLSMALSIAVGLPPQHGIYTAIVAGFLTALLGGSIYNVSGPTAAFVVIVAPIVVEYGLRGIIWCQIIAGFILIIMGMLRLGKLVEHIPNSVITGFTTGIAVVIGTLSLNDFFGLGIQKLPQDFGSKALLIFSRLPYLNINEFAIASVTTLIILFFGKVTKIVPTPIVAITAAAFMAYKIGDVSTIGNHFSYMADSGKIKSGIPPYPPFLHFPTLRDGELFRLPDFSELRSYFIPAFTIAILAALESLLSATIADKMTKTKHQPNAELNAIGIGNIFSGLCAGIPATGALARTATNINAGAVSPLAAAMHAILIMLYVMVLARFINFVPMSSLAALLFVTAFKMSHAHEFWHIARTGKKTDSIILLVSFGFTVFVDMVVGIGMGLVLAFIFRVYENKNHH